MKTRYVIEIGGLKKGISKEQYLQVLDKIKKEKQNAKLTLENGPYITQIQNTKLSRFTSTEPVEEVVLSQKH